MSLTFNLYSRMHNGEGVASQGIQFAIVLLGIWFQPRGRSQLGVPGNLPSPNVLTPLSYSQQTGLCTARAALVCKIQRD